MTLEQILAANLNKLMETTELDTIVKLHDRSKVGTGTIDRLRKGEVSTKLETVEKLASAFGLSSLQLLTHQADGMQLEKQPAQPSTRLERVSDDEGLVLSLFREMDQKQQKQALEIFGVMAQASSRNAANDEP